MVLIITFGILVMSMQAIQQVGLSTVAAQVWQPAMVVALLLCTAGLTLYALFCGRYIWVRSMLQRGSVAITYHTFPVAAQALALVMLSLLVEGAVLWLLSRLSHEQLPGASVYKGLICMHVVLWVLGAGFGTQFQRAVDKVGTDVSTAALTSTTQSF